MTVVHANFLRLMSAEQRASLGKREGMLPEEARAKQLARDEREAQSQIRQYLRLLEVEFICPDMRKRSALPTGWPDFTLCYRGVALALEVKVWRQSPEPHQVAMHERLARNGWRVEVIAGVAGVQRIFREVDANGR